MVDLWSETGAIGAQPCMLVHTSECDFARTSPTVCRRRRDQPCHSLSSGLPPSCPAHAQPPYASKLHHMHIPHTNFNLPTHFPPSHLLSMAAHSLSAGAFQASSQYTWSPAGEGAAGMNMELLGRALHVLNMHQWSIFGLARPKVGRGAGALPGSDSLLQAIAKATVEL